jgi:hypothetical protein
VVRGETKKLKRKKRNSYLQYNSYSYFYFFFVYLFFFIIILFMLDGYVSFSGTNTLTTSSPSFNINSHDFTIEAWVRLTLDTGIEADWFIFGSVSSTRTLLVNGIWSTHQYVGAFFNDDLLSSPLYVADEYQWTFYTLTFTSSTRVRTIYRNSVSIANDVSVGQLNAGPLITIGSNGAYPYHGDIDELMIFKTALSQPVIAAHMNGQYFGYLNSANLFLWNKFSEGTGTTSTDIISSNVFTWSGAQGWSSNTLNPNCVQGYFNSYALTVSSSSVPAGTMVTLTVYQVDNHGNKMDTYSPPAPTQQVTVTFNGAGTTLPAPTLLSLVGGKGNITFTSNIREAVTFSLTDTASNGRTLPSRYSTSVSFYGGGKKNKN